ncbi:MAG: hypothetical protein ACYC2H_01100 [Thermoplasmatota archaeon]
MSKASRAAKGTRVELRAKKILEGTGYVVHRTRRNPAKRRGRWMSHGNDIYGCIDLIAKRHGERTRWIQCLSNGAIGAKRRKVARVPWDLTHDSVELWRWVDGKKRRIDRRNGKPRDRLYFQVYVLDDDFSLHKERRIRQ